MEDKIKQMGQERLKFAATPDMRCDSLFSPMLSFASLIRKVHIATYQSIEYTTNEKIDCMRHQNIRYLFSNLSSFNLSPTPPIL